MADTLVIQSHRSPLPFAWLETCLDSVAAWARQRRFDYRYLGDELFDPLSADLRDRTRARPVIASDLARLEWLRRGLEEGYATVVWCDADFLVFDPHGFEPVADDFAVGREVWVQRDAAGRLRAYVKVHNAFLMFRRGNRFLDFYIDTATRLLRLNQGGVPPQFIGPKLLTALHNVAQFPVVETAAMLSPLVLRDLLAGGGAALELLRRRSPAPPAAANLGGSLCESAGFGEADMTRLIERLRGQGL